MVNIFLASVTECVSIDDVIALWNDVSSADVQEASSWLFAHQERYFAHYDGLSSMMRKLILLKSLEHVPELTSMYLHHFIQNHYSRWYIYYIPLVRSSCFVDAFHKLSESSQATFLGYLQEYLKRYTIPEKAVGELFEDMYYQVDSLHCLLFHPRIWPLIQGSDLSEEKDSGIGYAKKYWTDPHGRQLLLAFSSEVTPNNDDERSWLMQYKIMGPPSLWPHSEGHTIQEMDLHFP